MRAGILIEPGRLRRMPFAELIDDVGHDLLGGGFQILHIDNRDPELFRTLEEILGTLAGDRRAAARLLAGEVLLSLGRGKDAEKMFREAEKEGRKRGLADDAMLGRVRALELAGRDVEAYELSGKWLEKHSSSALVPEVRLVRAWNDLRRDALDEAESALEEIATSSPWLRSDPRFVLASAGPEPAARYLV